MCLEFAGRLGCRSSQCAMRGLDGAGGGMLHAACTMHARGTGANPCTASLPPRGPPGAVLPTPSPLHGDRTCFCKIAPLVLQPCSASRRGGRVAAEPEAVPATIAARRLIGDGASSVARRALLAWRSARRAHKAQRAAKVLPGLAVVGGRPWRLLRTCARRRVYGTWRHSTLLSKKRKCVVHMCLESEAGCHQQRSIRAATMPRVAGAACMPEQRTWAIMGHH